MLKTGQLHSQLTNFKIEILQGATKILSFFTELVTKEICAYLI